MKTQIKLSSLSPKIQVAIKKELQAAITGEIQSLAKAGPKAKQRLSSPEWKSVEESVENLYQVFNTTVNTITQFYSNLPLEPGDRYAGDSLTQSKIITKLRVSPDTVPMGTIRNLLKHAKSEGFLKSEEIKS